MKWIGQHIWDQISRFRNDVYLESVSESAQDHVVGIDANGKLYKQDVATGDITGVTITTDSGGGSAASDTGGSADFSILGTSGVGVTNSGTTITVTSVPGEIDHDSLLNFASNEHFTMADIDSIGTDGDTLSILSDRLYMSNTTADKPDIYLQNTANDADASALYFVKKRFDSSTQAGQDNDYLGRMWFVGFNDAGTPGSQTYAGINAQIHDATDGEESGILNFQVANHDGGLGTGLYLRGGSQDNEIDIGIGLGSSSQTAISGHLNVSSGINLEASTNLTIDDTAILSDSSGTTTLSNIDALDATTEATIESAIDTLSNLTAASSLATVGTITSGTWQGTTIAIDQGGTGNTTGVQGGKNYRIYNTSFRADIGTTKYYIPLKSQDEQTVLTREEVSELAVCDGRVVSVSLRTEALNTHSGDATVTFGVEANTVGSAYNSGFSSVETEALTINDADDQHFFHYVFDTAKHWDSTDMWAISIQSDTDISGNNERFFVTVVVEDDWSTYLGGVSREIDTTP